MADVVDVDAATGTVVERDFTAQEVAQRETDAVVAEQEAAALAQRVAARDALLARLGLTEDEFALLISAIR